VVTIGINPSAREFFDNRVLKPLREKFPMQPTHWNPEDWAAKPLCQRLTMLRDFALTSRELLTDQDVVQAKNALEVYFADDQRGQHPFFTRLQSLLSDVNTGWSYWDCTAAHIDIVACTTARDWSDVPSRAQTTMLRNCQVHLGETLALLKPDVWLLVDGAKAWTALHEVCTLSIRAEGHVSSHIESRVAFRWATGCAMLKADSASKLRYVAWNTPWQQHRMFDLKAYHVELLKLIIGFADSDEQLRSASGALKSPSWR
jgi:hypothetical protein